MLTKQLRHILSSKSIAESMEMSEGTVRNIIAGMQGDSHRDRIDYEIAGQALLAIKERHDQYILEQDHRYQVTGDIPGELRDKQKEEREIFLENNTR